MKKLYILFTKYFSLSCRLYIFYILIMSDNILSGHMIICYNVLWGMLSHFSSILSGEKIYKIKQSLIIIMLGMRGKNKHS